MQHAEDDGDRHVRRIGVPQPIAETVEPAPVIQAADLVLLVEVGDVADLRNGEPAFAGARGGPTDLQRTEACGEVAKLRVGEALVTEDHHRVAIDGRPDGIDGVGIRRSGEIDAGDLGGE